MGHFFHQNFGENKYLLEQIICSDIVIIENIIFQYAWIINIFLYFGRSNAKYDDIIGFAFDLFEIFGRFISNYFRL
ncbi:unnamed protein product [Rotaria sordida]|uniref:Uncharacterized protein n=1 Tax=Rotaria sordida TaxID=392033 RepID=A0A819MJC0_9BILA|nr:unnamed protein product [Rotaria sordida]CAF0911915.1 unnamed protein product [Rotaria sordida]CAF0927228.1 unnamed protein product [Rotaria sordida]CAF0979122.1 unnamed protein product [Rotaria sordida]CAF3844055.1 unnamed protein product [Rotaria sordida]